MSRLLIAASFLAIAIGIAHSWLGERYIIIRLLHKDDLPKLFGDDAFTRQTLRFAWHLTTAGWWGLAVILLFMGGFFTGVELAQGILVTIGFTFLASALLSIIFTRGKHLSWIVFLAIAILCGIAIL